MALVNADFVEETTTTTGTGALTLAGATDGNRTFASAIGLGNECVYSIKASNGQRESGIGTLDSGTGVLQRTTFLASTTGATLNLPAGVHTVFCTLSGTHLGSIGSALLYASSSAEADTALGIPQAATTIEMETGTEVAARKMSPALVRAAIDAVTGDIEAALNAING